ncbi:MAG: hypothetical protein ACTHQQ_02715 [Solirubrobacteraceae bacterium]
MIAATAAVLLVLAAVPLILGAGSSGARAHVGGRTVTSRPAGPFAWLRPLPAPAGWQHATTASSQATLFYPPGWRRVSGDRGTVSRALRDRRGRYIGYVNVTPRQGAEQPHRWAAFRTGHNRDEGDKQVREVAAAEDLHFRNASGSCVIDDYLSKVGSNPYREIACLITGHRHADVFIGAALRPHWRALSGTLERAASAFVQR